MCDREWLLGSGDRLDQLAHGRGHGRLDALGDDVDDQLAHDRVVLEGRDHLPCRVALAGGLVQERVRADQREDGAEVAPQPDCDRRNEVRERAGA